MTTTALPVGERGHHLTGHKSWCSNAARADELVVVARTASSSISAFLVPRGAPGALGHRGAAGPFGDQASQSGSAIITRPSGKTAVDDDSDAVDGQ